MVSILMCAGASVCVCVYAFRISLWTIICAYKYFNYYCYSYISVIWSVIVIMDVWFGWWYYLTPWVSKCPVCWCSECPKIETLPLATEMNTWKDNGSFTGAEVELSTHSLTSVTVGFVFHNDNLCQGKKSAQNSEAMV